MDEKEYKKHKVTGIVCDIASLFILGYVFSAIAYKQFDINYQNSLDDRLNRRNSMVWKVVSSFFFFMSIAYHSQGRNDTLLFRMEVAIIVAFVGALIVFFVLNHKDKKIDYFQNNNQKQTKKSDKKELELEDSKCGESLEEEKENNIDKKYSDLIKLKKLYDDKIITKTEFEKEKKKILDNE